MLNLFAPPAGLLGDQEEQVRQQMQQQGLLGLAAGLFEAGAPSRQRQSLGGSAIRGLMAGQQAAQGTFDQTLKAMTLRQQMEEASQKAERERRASAALSGVQSRLVGGGTNEAQNFQNLTYSQLLELSATPDLDKDMRNYLLKLADAKKPRSQDISPDAALYAQSKYGTPNVAELSQEQAADVLGFMRQPSIDQRIALARFGFETGGSVPGVNAPVIAPSTITPSVQTPAAEPSPSAQLPSIPKEISGKPLGKNEVPLIQSQALSPKQKQDLELKRPTTIGAVEYAIDQTRQMRNTALRLLANPNLERAFGITGAIETKIPQSPAADVFVQVDLLKNQSFVQGIQAMRAANETGGAVGNVSDAEGKRFENLQAALGQVQSGSQARKELERLVKELEGTEERLKSAFERTYGKGTEFQIRPIFEAPKKPTRRRGPVIRQDDEDLIRKHLPR
jgi:hypothetical protein